MSTFWDFFWLMVWMFFFITYLIVLFQVIVDLFRDHSLNGWAKAAWVIALIFLPLLTTLIYLIFRGGGMGRRQMEAAYEARSETESYIRSVASTSPAEQIAHANALLKDGAISQAEFDRLKAKALA